VSLFEMSEGCLLEYNSVEVLIGVPTCYPKKGTRLDIAMENHIESSTINSYFSFQIRNNRSISFEQNLFLVIKISGVADDEICHLKLYQQHRIEAL
ncbi:unnamed protein product, partial [Dovyalis caffra]